MKNILIGAMVVAGVSMCASVSHEKMQTVSNELKNSKVSTVKDMTKTKHFEQLLKEKFSQTSFSKSKLTMKESAKMRHDLKQGKRAAKGLKHTVVFSVQQQNLDKLELYLNDVSDPKSKNFGKHMTRKEVVAMTANPDAVIQIEQYLESLGAKIVKRTKYEDYIHAEATIDVWEKAFDAKFFEFEHVDDPSVKLVRALEYSLPDSLSQHVSSVFNTVQFPEVVERKHVKALRKEMNLLSPEAVAPHPASKVKTLANGYITPAVLNSYYNINSNTGNALGSQAVYEALNQTYSPTDLTFFQELFLLPVQPVTTVIGGHVADNACSNSPSGSDNCAEANLDVQYLMAVSQVTNTTYYYWTGTDLWLDWVTTMAESDDPPLVVSISYSSYELYTPLSTANSFNTEVMKLSVMGVTLVAAAGDDGVVGFFGRDSPIWCGYYPQFPASSPYVVAVGGTMGPESNTEEIACQSQLDGVITTGGGFSTLFPQPAWQSEVVNSYLTSVSNTNYAPQPGYVASGRGYPDVSLAAAKYPVVLGAPYIGVLYGTSASSPVFAGMIALVNAKRLAAGKSALGWINPSLYALYSSFLKNDITSGENNCVADAVLCCSQGFYAMPGWDPVTGLGSVNYANFETAFFALGDDISEPTNSPVPAPGQPTNAPVQSPTMAPSGNPTSAPTNSAGWIVVNAYYGTDCTGDSATVIGVATEQCQITYDESGAVDGSVMYSCGSVYASVMRYSDEFCTVPASPLPTHKYFLSCAESVDSYAAASIFSESLTCVANNNIYPLPLTGNYAIDTNYNANACGGNPASFAAYLNGFCFNYGLPESGISFKYSYPDIYIYDGGDCAHYVETETISETCAAVPYEPHDDDYFGQEWGTNTLTEQWSLQTNADNSQFQVTQTFAGISYSAYTNNLDANNAAVVSAVISTLYGVQPYDVLVTGVAGSGRRLLEEIVVSRHLSTDSVVVYYTVSYNYATLGYSDAATAYTGLTTLLNNAVADGTFAAAVNTYASNNDVQDMTTVTTSAVAYSGACPLSTGLDDTNANCDYGSGSSSKSNAGMIAGVVIAVLVAVAFLAAIAYYYGGKRQPALSAQTAKNVDEGGVDLGANKA